LQTIDQELGVIFPIKIISRPKAVINTKSQIGEGTTFEFQIWKNLEESKKANSFIKDDHQTNASKERGSDSMNKKITQGHIHNPTGLKQPTGLDD
jgi:hypothetical protein